MSAAALFVAVQDPQSPVSIPSNLQEKVKKIEPKKLLAPTTISPIEREVKRVTAKAEKKKDAEPAQKLSLISKEKLRRFDEMMEDDKMTKLQQKMQQSTVAKTEEPKVEESIGAKIEEPKIQDTVIMTPKLDKTTDKETIIPEETKKGEPAVVVQSPKSNEVNQIKSFDTGVTSLSTLSEGNQIRLAIAGASATLVAIAVASVAGSNDDRDDKDSTVAVSKSKIEAADPGSTQGSNGVGVAPTKSKTDPAVSESTLSETPKPTSGVSPSIAPSKITTIEEKVVMSLLLEESEGRVENAVESVTEKAAEAAVEKIFDNMTNR